MAYELRWQDSFFPLYGDIIHLPAGTILWRGFDPAYSAISDRPANFGAREFAQGYADKYGVDASPFITTRMLRLLDIRFMKVLLTQLFEQNAHTSTDRDIISATSIAFGLCTLPHQIKLFKERYRTIYSSTNSLYESLKAGVRHLESLVKPDVVYEQQGYRIAETTNDAIVMGFLKELFGQYYDGFISPNVMSPFHIEKDNFILNSELIVFNPFESGISLVKSFPSKIQPLSINQCILTAGHTYRTIDTRNMKTSFYVKSSVKKGRRKIEVCDDYNHLYDKGDTTIIQSYNQGIKHGKRWNKKPVKLITSIAPGPTFDPTLFHHYDCIV